MTEIAGLRIDVYAVNAVIGPQGLCHMLLVFGEITRPARTSHSAIHVCRMKNIEEAKKEALKKQSK